MVVQGWRLRGLRLSCLYWRRGRLQLLDWAGRRSRLEGPC